MKARTISVVALLAVLCIASFVLWNFTRVAANAAKTVDGLEADTTLPLETDTTTDQNDVTDVIRAEIPASGTVELCQAVLPGNKVDDPNIRQRGPQSLHWINELYQGDTGHLFLPYDFRENFGHRQQTLAYLRRFNDALKTQNVQLAMLVLPPRTMIYNESLEGTSRPYNLEIGYQNYLDSLGVIRGLGIVAPDLATPFFELAKTDAVYFKRDHHWTPEAARAAAQALATELQGNDVFQDLPKQIYTTVQNGQTVLADSTYMLRVEAVCGLDIEDEPVNIYQTELTTDDNATNSLFGDAPKIPVVLAGTSHSAKEIFNFSGFLQESLSKEVLNLSVEAGGQFASLMQFLLNEEQRSVVSEPSLLIWEREFQGSLVKRYDNDFRQIIPSIYGTCSNEDAIASRSIEATGGKSIGLTVPAGVSGSEYYLSAEIADLSIRRPTAVFRYKNGTEERIPLGNPRVRPKNFYLELLNGDAGELDKLVMQFPKDVFGNIDLRICKSE